jgi:Protein NO VEIN, C-terminal
LLFWRGVTYADFFNIERTRQAGPAGGGGQSYISISFQGLAAEDLARFLGVTPSDRLLAERPTVRLDSVGVVGDPDLRAPLEFAPRYKEGDPRYRIARQNRQFQTRHPAWSSARGFPVAPDDVVRGDTRMPDLAYLKIYVAQLDSAEYVAGFTNRDVRPSELPNDPQLDVLFEPFDEHRSAGVMEFPAGVLSVEALAGLAESAAVLAEYADSAPEVLEVVDRTRVAAGRRPTGQGRRRDPRERRAIELHGMALATERLVADGWSVEDVSLYRSFDLLCTKDGQELHVEVKGTTGDGSSVLLTPGEVVHARVEHPNVALVVVSEILLTTNPETGEPVTDGGSLEVVLPWEIDAQGELRATGFDYRRHE